MERFVAAAVVPECAVQVEKFASWLQEFSAIFWNSRYLRMLVGVKCMKTTFRGDGLEWGPNGCDRGGRDRGRKHLGEDRG